MTSSDGALKLPSTTGEKVRFIIALICSIAGQTLQNISVPMFLSTSTDDVGVMVTYTCFVYMMFFALLDMVLNFFSNRKQHLALDVSHRHVAWVGFLNAMSGVGILFAGDPSRTPLPLQMSFFLFCNQMAPAYKLLRRYGFHWGHWKAAVLGTGRQGAIMLAVATAGYLISMLLVLSDNLSHEGTQPMSPYALLFVFGTMSSMMYNVDQDKAMAESRTVLFHSGETASHEDLSFMTQFRRDVLMLKYQTAWLFVAGWIGPLVSLCGASPFPVTKSFQDSWGDLLPFGNTWINCLNIGYIITFLGNIYINRFDSALTMLIGNVSAVSAMWTGWVPSLMPDTVGFVPNYAKTITAMVLSIAAIFPSWEFSKDFRHGIAAGDASVDSEETAGVNNYLLNVSKPSPAGEA